MAHPAEMSLFPRAAAWVLPALLLGGLTLAAVRVAAPAPGAGFPDRPDEVAPGTTWVYRTTSNGRPAGLLRVQAIRDTLVVQGAAGVLATVFALDSDDFGGLGPVREISYHTATDQAEMVLGFRPGTTGAAGFESLVPPRPKLRYPLRPGAAWEWEGSAGSRRERWRAEVLETGALEVLGATRSGCMRVRTIVEPVEATEGAGFSSDVWFCPGLDVVRAEVELLGGGTTVGQELIEYHAPGVDLVAPGAPSPTPPSDPELGGTVGMTPSRSSHIPDVRALFDRLLWTDSRAGNANFSAVGGPARSLLAEEDGSVSMMDTRTGRILWRVRLTGPIVAPPVLAGSLAIVADSRALFALDAETGATRWSAVFDDLVSGSPLVHDGIVVVATDDLAVHGLRLGDGERLWQAETGALADAAPALAGERVVLGDEEGSLVALGLHDGRAAWEAATEGELTSGPITAGGLVVASDDNGVMSAFDARTGEIRWKRPLGRFGFSETPPAADAEGIGFVWRTTTEESFITVLEAADGRLRWERELPGEATVGPAVLGSELVVMTDRGRLMAFAMADGSIVDQTTLPRVLEGPSSRNARFDLSYVDGALVATVRENAADLRLGWAATASFAFPADEDRADRADGIGFSSHLRPIPDPWQVRPILVDDDLVYPGTEPVVWAVEADGTPQVVVETGEGSPFVVAGEDLLLTQVGTEIVALDPATREARWAYEIGPPQAGFAPAEVDDAVAVPVPGRGLAMLDRATGRERWFRPIDGVGRSAPAPLPGGDVAYAVGGLTRYDGRTGEPIWTIPGIETFGPPAVDGDLLVVSALTGDRAFLLAVDARSGEERWRHPLAPEPFIGPAVGAGVAVGVNDTGLAVGLDAETGEPRWSYQMLTPTCGTPLVTGGRVILFEGGRSEDLDERDHRVVVLDAASGRFLGSIEPPGSSTAPADCGGDGDRLILSASLVAQVTRMSPP